MRKGNTGYAVPFLFDRQLSNDRHIIHGNLLLSIAISQTIFLAGIGHTENKVCVNSHTPLIQFLAVARHLSGRKGSGLVP